MGFTRMPPPGLLRPGRNLIAVRVGIFLGRTPVRRPPRVPDAVIAVERIEPDRFFEISQLALGTPQAEMMVVINDRDARRVIAAVLEFPEAVDDQRHNLFISNVSYNSAHIRSKWGQVTRYKCPCK